jgi:molybdenum cofactor synthesis domain-containing protein
MEPVVIRALAVTVSNRAAAGVYADKSGPVLVEELRAAGCAVVDGPLVIADGDPVEAALRDAIEAGYDVVVTTGGTGLGPRDVTPQATSAVIDFEVPGIGEAMRRAGAASTPMAALSRSMAGVRGQTLIINVPGSPRGAAESLEAVIPTLAHAIRLLHGNTAHG